MFLRLPCFGILNIMQTPSSLKLSWGPPQGPSAKQMHVQMEDRLS